MDWTHMGADEGLYYANSRIPAMFFFYDKVVAPIWLAPPASFTVTEKLTGRESYPQLQSAGVTAPLETGQDEISFDFYQAGMVMFYYNENCMLWFS